MTTNEPVEITRLREQIAKVSFKAGRLSMAKEIWTDIVKRNKAGGNYYSNEGFVKTFSFNMPLDEWEKVKEWLKEKK